MGGTRLKPPDLGQLIETVELVNGAVTTPKLADNSVTNAKIAPHVSTKITGLAPQTQTFVLNGNDLIMDVGIIQFTSPNTSIQDVNGTLRLEATVGDSIHLAIANMVEYSFSATVADFNGNIINLSTITLQEVSDQAVMTIADDVVNAGLKIENTDGGIELVNGAGVVGKFSPALIFNVGGDELAIGQVINKIPVASDNGGKEALRIGARRIDNSPLQDRAILAIYNFGTKLAQYEADGTYNIFGNKINLSDITLQQVGIKAEIKIPDSSSGGGLKVGDNNGFVQLINGTGTVGAFLPTIQMRTNNATKPALIIGELETGTDTGTQPALVLEGRLQGPAALTTRPILSIQNHITKVFEIAADGTQDFQGNKLTGIGTDTITDLTPVTGAAGDFVWIIDATDGLSKKVDVSDFLGGITGDLDLVDGSTIRWAGVANRRITNTGAGFAFEVETPDNFTFQIASVNEYVFDATQADWKGNNLTGMAFINFDKISAPANPPTEKGRLYLKQIDANNNGLFVKIKQAGGIVEVKLS